MKLFVSHSLSDTELLQKIKETLEPYGIKLLIAEHIVDLNSTITDKIENMIRNSDIAIIMLTENGFNSNFVQQEVGYIKSLNKPFLQLVQSGFENKLSGFNFGRDYILYDPKQPDKAILKTQKVLISFWNKMKEKQLAIQRKESAERIKIIMQKKKEEEQLKVGLGILAGVIALGLLFGD